MTRQKIPLVQCLLVLLAKWSAYLISLIAELVKGLMSDSVAIHRLGLRWTFELPFIAKAPLSRTNKQTNNKLVTLDLFAWLENKWKFLPGSGEWNDYNVRTTQASKLNSNIPKLSFVSCASRFFSLSFPYSVLSYNLPTLLLKRGFVVQAHKSILCTLKSEQFLILFVRSLLVPLYFITTTTTETETTESSRSPTNSSIELGKPPSASS